MKILVQIYGGLGDELCLTPIYKALKKKYPNCEITAFVKYRELLLHNPNVDILLSASKQSVNIHDYDLTIPMRWQTGVFEQYSNMHLVDFFAMQARVVLEDRSLEMFFMDDEYDYVNSLNLPKDRPIITFDAYANKEANRWGSKYFRELNYLMKKKHNAYIVQIGLKQYKITHIDLDTTNRNTIRQLATLIQRSTLYIGNNSGAAHIASACKTPSVKIYGCTWADCYTHDRKIEYPISLDIECQGCQNKKPGMNPIHKSKHIKCPTERQYECVYGLLPDKVMEAVDVQLDNFYYKG